MKHVFVADDDPGIRDVFLTILERAGYSVTLSAGGQILMENEFEKPDLFILDRQLSGIDGLEVCRHLKNTEGVKDVPVIIISASPYVSRMAGEAGADAFIEKPFSTKELMKLVNKLLNNNHIPAAQS